jgi:hypothetical protein
MITTSAEVGNVSGAVIDFQAEVESVKKGADNPFFKSKYADLPSILAVVKPTLEKHKLGIIQAVTPCGDTLLCATRIIHASGEWIEATTCLTAEKQTPQGYGSAITYLRRYGIQSALGLSAEDDDGETAETPSRKKPKANRTPVNNEPTYKDGISAETKAQVIELGWTKDDCEDAWKGCSCDKKTFAKFVGAEATTKADNLPY